MAADQADLAYLKNGEGCIGGPVECGSKRGVGKGLVWNRAAANGDDVERN